MRLLPFAWLLSCSLALTATTAVASGNGLPTSLPTPGPPASAEQFVKACTNRLALSDEQRTALRTYLEQEINYMAVQAANHSAAEVTELIPAERAQLQLVAGKLLSTDQLRQFRELEATPKMRAYLRQMSLGE